MRTGQEDSKFGFGLPNGAAAAAAERAQASPAVELVGFHAHVGSQVFAVENFARVAELMAVFARPYGLPTMTLGGGLGVAYVEGESAPTITEWARVLRKAVDEAGFQGRLLVEPGRAIVASAAITVYTVGTIKDIPGIRTYVAVDGGMSDNPRPVLYGSGYETFLPGPSRPTARGPSASSASTARAATSWSARAGCPTTSPSATCWPPP